MKVSIITPTIRPEGLDIIDKSLKKQTFQDFEWLVGSNFDPGISRAKWIPDNFTGGFWTLNRIYNSLIKSSSGDIIISWQDNIFCPPDTLQKFVDNLERCGKQAIISGVGDQYASVNKWGKPQIKIWSDPRKTTKYGTYYECTFPDIEWNLCALFKSALEDIGGFDSDLDFRGFGMDGYQVNERLDKLGYKFYLDQTLESYTVRHDRGDYGGDSEWDKNNNLSNGEYEKRRNELKLKGSWPRLQFLTE